MPPKRKLNTSSSGDENVVMARKKEVKRRKTKAPDLQKNQLIGRKNSELVSARITRATEQLIRQEISTIKARKNLTKKLRPSRISSSSSVINADSFEDEHIKTGSTSNLKETSRNESQDKTTTDTEIFSSQLSVDRLNGVCMESDRELSSNLQGKKNQCDSEDENFSIANTRSRRRIIIEETSSDTEAEIEPHSNISNKERKKKTNQIPNLNKRKEEGHSQSKKGLAQKDKLNGRIDNEKRTSSVTDSDISTDDDDENKKTKKLHKTKKRIYSESKILSSQEEVSSDDEPKVTSQLNKSANRSNNESVDQILPSLEFEDNTDDVDINMFKEPANKLNISCTENNIKTKNSYNWVTEATYDDLEEALERIEELGFILHNEHDLNCGQKFYFRCKHVPKNKKPWCGRKYILFLPSDRHNTYIVQHNDIAHNCHDIMKGQKKKISEEMQDYISELFEVGIVSIKTVMAHVTKEKGKGTKFQNEEIPGKRQIEYMLAKFRKEKVQPLFKLGDLMEWCHEHSDFPVNEDEMFVLSHECSPLNERLSFRFIMSTPNLLRRAAKFETVCIDATYKLNWHGFPLIVFGTVDRLKRFHPIAYACTTNETTADYEFVFEAIRDSIQQYFECEFQPKTLIADGADAIRNAFYNSFSSAELDVMCFAHVIRNIRKRPFSTKTNKQLILDDVRKVQLASNKQTFLMMTQLLCEKWWTAEEEFIEYFKTQWLGVHCNWYEGAAVYTPSTNNALESHNAVIKRTITMRRRLPLNQFLVCMTNLVEEISRQFSSGERSIEQKPAVKNKVLREAALLIQQQFKAFKAKTETLTYIVPSSSCPPELANVTAYGSVAKKKWKSFDEFVNHGYQFFWVVKVSSTEWDSESTCTCPAFFKQNMCKHIAAIAMRENILKYNDNSNPTLLTATRRKAGRVKDAKKALVKQ